MQQLAAMPGIFIGLLSDAWLAVAAAARRLANSAISSTFPVLAQSSLPFLYAAFTAILLLFVLKSVRETSGVELEDMPGRVPAGAPQWPQPGNSVRIWLAS